MTLRRGFTPKRRRTEWYSREQNSRLVWLGVAFGLCLGLACGIVAGYYYAGGFGVR